uniref:holo-[acyl-carrier-protein] synthase n=1 Tax=Arundo donax TaxID=35708 RepID=A0A0A9ESD2_ARUDO
MVEEESGVRRWLVDITRWRPSPAQFHAAAALLPPHDRAAITRFVKEDDRKRALVSRLLQYSLLHHVLRIPFQRIDICRTIEGKPYLQNKNVTFPNFNFNTSHQGDYVGIASEPLCLVGLDIVSISKPQGETATEFINNFSSYLTDHEWNCIIRAGTPDEVLTEFYRYWCLKEAFVKAIGAGVGFGLHRLEFHHVNWSNIYIRIDGEESKKWRFSLFKLDGMHLASIAKGHPEDAVNSYKKTLPNVIMEKEPLRALLEAPEEPFTLWTVEQLTELQD